VLSAPRCRGLASEGSLTLLQLGDRAHALEVHFIAKEIVFHDLMGLEETEPVNGNEPRLLVFLRAAQVLSNVLGDDGRPPLVVLEELR
jgi:hypothetical protein